MLHLRKDPHDSKVRVLYVDKSSRSEAEDEMMGRLVEIISSEVEVIGKDGPTKGQGIHIRDRGLASIDPDTYFEPKTKRQAGRSRHGDHRRLHR